MKAFFRKIKDWFIRHKPTKRRLIQVYAALLYNANIKGFVNGSIYTGSSKYVCVPGLNCYSCPGAVGACPLGALQNALAASGTKAPFYVFGIIILFGLLLGRTICGFLCPIGLLQDLLYKIKSPKLKKNKVTRVLSYFKYVILVVMVIMIPLAYAGISSAIPAFCKYICPSGTLLGSISLLANAKNGEDFFSMLGPLFTWKFVVLVLIIVGSIFIYRIFCRFFCPLGAIYSLFCRVAMIGVKLDKQKCVDCGLCIQTCKMDIKHVGDHECINCGDCLKVCPTKAITWKGSKIFLHPNAIEEGGDSAAGEKVALSSLLASSTGNGGTIAVNAGGASAKAAAAENVTAEGTEETTVTIEETAPVVEEPAAQTVVAETAAQEVTLTKEERAAQRQLKTAQRRAYHGTLAYQKKRNKVLEICAWALALVVLAVALIYYNFIAEDVQASTTYEVGDTVESFTMKKYFGDEDATYTLQDDLDAGKVVVLNFWYIGCQPCQEELPDFGELAATYPDEVSLVVIHSSTVSTSSLSSLEGYVQNYMGWDFWAYDNVSFTLDNSDENSLYYAFDGIDAYPMTVILDSSGVMRYRYTSKMEKTELFSCIETLLGE